MAGTSLSKRSRATNRQGTIKVSGPFLARPARGQIPCEAQARFRRATNYRWAVERLAANGLEPRLRGGVAEVARRLCGVQAQDAAAARLAVRARGEGLTAAAVDAEPAWCGRGRGAGRCTCSPARTWPGCSGSSPSARPLRYLPLARARPRRRHLRPRSRRDPRAPAGGPATRAQLREALAAAGVDASGQRLPHLVRRVALEGLLHHPLDGTFAALDPLGDPPPREAALAELGRRYAEGYGPAEAATWLRSAGCRRRTRAPLKPAATACAAATRAARRGEAVRLLARFDPYLLGYRGRGVAGRARARPAGMPGGGWIHAVVLVDGAAGTWRLDGATTRRAPVRRPPPPRSATGSRRRPRTWPASLDRDGARVRVEA